MALKILKNKKRKRFNHWSLQIYLKLSVEGHRRGWRNTKNPPKTPLWSPDSKKTNKKIERPCYWFWGWTLFGDVAGSSFVSHTRGPCPRIRMGLSFWSARHAKSQGVKFLFCAKLNSRREENSSLCRRLNSLSQHFLSLIQKNSKCLFCDTQMRSTPRGLSVYILNSGLADGISYTPLIK